MKVHTVLDAENTITVFLNRTAAVQDTLMHFASMEIEVEVRGDVWETQEIVGHDDSGKEVVWATIEEHEVSDS